MSKGLKTLGLVLFVLCLGGAVEHAAAQGGQCYGAACTGATCGGGKNYQSSRPCCCGMACLVKPDKSSTCVCALGCDKPCGTACAPACGSEGRCINNLAEPPTSLAPFVPTSDEVRAAISASGYLPLISFLLETYGKWSSSGSGLENGVTTLRGNVNTGFLPEPWQSLPKRENVVAYKALITVSGPEATVTLVFDNLPAQELRDIGKRRLRRLPPDVAIRLAMGNSAADVTPLGPAEVEEALAAMKDACERQAGVAP